MPSLGSAIDLSWYGPNFSAGQRKAVKTHSRDEDNGSKDPRENVRKQNVWTKTSPTVDHEDLKSAIDDRLPPRSDKARRASYPAKQNRPSGSDHVVDLNVPLPTTKYVEPRFYFVPLRPLPTFVIKGKNGETLVVDGSNPLHKDKTMHSHKVGRRKSHRQRDDDQEDRASSKEMGEHLGWPTYNPKDTNGGRARSTGKTHRKDKSKKENRGSGQHSVISVSRVFEDVKSKESSVVGLGAFEEDQGQQSSWIHASSKAASVRSKAVDDPHFQGVGFYDPKSQIRKTVPFQDNFKTAILQSGSDSKPAALSVPTPSIQAWLSNPGFEAYVPPPSEWVAPPDRISSPPQNGASKRALQPIAHATAGQASAPKLNSKVQSQTRTVHLENLYSKPASYVPASPKATSRISEIIRDDSAVKSQRPSRKYVTTPAIPIKTSRGISAQSRASKKTSVSLGSVAKSLLGFGSSTWGFQPTPSKVASVLVNGPSKSYTSEKSKAVYEDVTPRRVAKSKAESGPSWNVQYPSAKTLTHSSRSHISTKSKSNLTLVPQPEIDTWAGSPQPPLDTWTTPLPSLHPRDSVSQIGNPSPWSSDHEFVQPTYSLRAPPRTAEKEKTPTSSTRVSKYHSPTVESVHSSRASVRAKYKTKTKAHTSATHTNAADKANQDPPLSPHTNKSTSTAQTSPHRPRKDTHTPPAPAPPASIANSRPFLQSPTWGTLGDGHCNREIGGTAVSVSEWRLADGTPVVSSVGSKRGMW